MKKFQTLLLLFIFIFGTNASVIYGEDDREFSYARFLNFPHLEKHQKMISQELSYFSSEEEYEVSNQILSLSESKSLRYNVRGTTPFNIPLNYCDNLTFDFQIKTTINGELTKTYDQSLGFSREHIDFRGIDGYRTSVLKKLAISNNKTFYGARFFLQGHFLGPKETNSSYGGTDVGMEFLLSHQHDRNNFYAKAKTEIVGRKKIELLDGGREIVDAYSILGVLVGYQYLIINNQSEIPVNLTLRFDHTTDYNTKSPKLTRRTDKGFIWGGEISFSKKINHQNFLHFMHARESYVFNVISNQRDQNIDYEIEQNESSLTWVYLW